MLYQPTNITPSSFAGVGGDVVDAAAGMTVSWQVNGTSPMTGYAITIYKNDAASTQMYTTGTVVLTDPFYSTDGNGNVQRYSVTILASEFKNAGIVNGYENGYKFKITQYWGSSIAVEQTSESFFVTHAKPTVTITTTGFDSPTEALEATYTQAQGVGLDWVRWQVYVYGDANDPTGGGLVMDSGIIHTQELSYEHGGWINGTEYYIVLSYQAQDGQTGSAAATAEAEWTENAVSLRMSPTARVSPDCAGVLVKYPMPTYGLMTTMAGSSDVENGALLVDVDEYGTNTWNSYGISPLTEQKFSAAWCFSTESYADFYLNGVSFPGLSDSANALLRVYADYSGSGYGYFQVAIYDGTGYLVQQGWLLPFSLTGKTVTVLWNNPVYDGGRSVLHITARDDETGETAKYSFLSVDGKISRSTGTSPTAGKIAFAAGGVQSLYYAGLLNDRADAYMIDTLTAGDITQPELTGDWLYLTNFSGEELTDSVGTFAETGFGTYLLERFDVYRTVNGAALMERVYRSPSFSDEDADTENADFGRMIDYATANGSIYEYTVIYTWYYVSAGTHYTTATSAAGSVKPCWWRWILLTAAEDDDGVYHMEDVFQFALNVETGAMGNNNSPSLLTNFTKYPTRQGVTANYRAGSLSAYIGKVQDNAYVDTAAQAQTIMDISASTAAKFLKSRKGELWKVDTAGPISLKTGDKYREQPYTASLSWAETGSTDGVSVICVPTDSSWQELETDSEGVYVTGLTVRTMPTKTTYTQYQTLNTAGLSVVATYSDGTTANVTDECTISPANRQVLRTTGTQAVNISYSYGDVAAYTSFTVTVAAATYIALLSTTSGFTLATSNGAKNWDGTLYYSKDGNTWTAWSGTTTISASGGSLYLRGLGNTVISGWGHHGFTLDGSNIACYGNIENLLDYADVSDGDHPDMGSYAFASLFARCAALISAPTLGAETMTEGCYNFMFDGCIRLTTPPALPATTLAKSCYAYMFRACYALAALPSLAVTTSAERCYQAMFMSCISIQISEMQTGSYQTAYRIPTSGTGTAATYALLDMFASTGGTFTGTPTINTTYYLSA